MVTMVLFPEKTTTPAQKLVHVDNNQLLLTALEPYTTTALIELANRADVTVGLPQRRKRKIWVAPPGESQASEARGSTVDAGLDDVKGKSSFAMNGSVCLFGSIMTWALLVCLLVFSLKGSHYPEDDEQQQMDLGNAGGLSHRDRVALESLHLDGTMSFTNTTSAAFDFGRIRFSEPAAVVYPKSVHDVEATVRAVRRSAAGLTLAAKGRGHSVHGQAQALHGVVLEMSSLKGIRVAPHGEPGCRRPFVDAAGGALWIDVLQAALKVGFAPRSWTDYLYLSIGGTLSNAGVGGQTFLFGPEISNVLQLDVVTGTGQLTKCSPTKNPDLFHGVLGGLGQFGIITSARIVIEPAHEKARWIRVMYTDFATFTRDQELLVSQPPESAFDYIEGFVILKNADSNNGWNSVPFGEQKIDPSAIPSDGGSVLYYIELVKKFSDRDILTLNPTVESMLSTLRFVPHLIFTTDVPYERFLNRLHEVEVNLASQGLWDVPHPWLNLFVPQSAIAKFDSLIFKHMIKDDFSGPILIYPLKRERWDARSSAVIPEESVFYLVAFLRIALPSSGPPLGSLIAENDKIMEVCDKARLGCKMYLPEYGDVHGWKRHFGTRWEDFERRKRTYDPDFIFAPGQNIFQRGRDLGGSARDAGMCNLGPRPPGF